MEVTDKKLYEKIKKKVYADIPKNSAYRSGILVKKYKEAFKKKYKNTRKKPYKRNSTKKKGLRTGGKVRPHNKPPISPINNETPPQYQENDNVFNFENEFDELDEFDEFLRLYKETVKGCFEIHKGDIHSSTNLYDLNEHKTHLLLLHSETIDGDTYNFCDDLPDMDFPLNRNFIINIDDTDKDIITNTINNDIINHIHRYINDELRENINKNDLKQEIENFENEFNREIFPNMNELNYLKIDCICLIKMIMTEIIQQYFYPEDYDSDDNWDDFIEPDYEGGKKRKKCNKPKRYSQKQHYKYRKNKTRKIKRRNA